MSTNESETEMIKQTYTREDMARAWAEAYGDGYRDAQEYRDSGGWGGCGPDAHDCTCPNPYLEEA